MATPPQTTVHLTERAQVVKGDLAPIYGLKNILSAGLILLSKVPREKREDVIAEANQMNLSSESAAKLDETAAALRAEAIRRKTRRHKPPKAG